MSRLEWLILLLSGWRAPDFRAGAGCPVHRGAPDVRGSAGCPAAVESPDFCLSLVFFWLVAPDVRAPAGCPAAVAPRLLHLSYFLIRFRVDLFYALSISMVVSSVPKDM